MGHFAPMRVFPFLPFAALAGLCLIGLQACAKPVSSASTMNQPDPNLPSIVLGGGCFWCVEALYETLEGVAATISGYAGGEVPNPTYEAVCGGETGHAEVVRVVYDPEQVSLETLLDFFWEAHDPTTLNRQGADVGTQYRSIILYADEAQKAAALASRDRAAARFADPIVTEIEALEKFYEAEVYHQDYYANNMNAPYCRYVIAPKLKKLSGKEG
jgi:peptide-methionine (S)-S-oxide reductase